MTLNDFKRYIKHFLRITPVAKGDAEVYISSKRGSEAVMFFTAEDVEASIYYQVEFEARTHMYFLTKYAAYNYTKQRAFSSYKDLTDFLKAKHHLDM